MKFISRENISALLAELADGAEVWAPREPVGPGAVVMFEHWRQGDPVDFEHFSATSAKDVVLPRTEKLFGFSYAFGGAQEGSGNLFGGERIRIEPELPGGRTVLFGTRACDARALFVLDSMFNAAEGDAREAYNDPHYRARRAGLTVITLACVTCDAACFCSSFGKGTAETAGSDVFLYPVEGGFLAEAVSEGGRAVVASSLFEASELEPPQLAVPTIVEGLSGLEKKLPAIFDRLELWEKLTASCSSCGFCTHGCPTCYCFNIHDEMRGDREGERLRSWDACMFSLYAQEASGHNPRPTVAHRYRNRINHKFSYFPENNGEILCTGCGRCIRGCPADIDIRDALRAAVSEG